MRFKLEGYTETDGKGDKVPLSGMAVASWARTRTDQNPAPDHMKGNNNLLLDEVSLFLAGSVSNQLGAFMQVTYDGVGRTVALDQMDLRWAKTVSLGGKDTILGVSLNNNPTVQDPFNTLSTWSFPFTGSPAGFGTGGSASLINGGLSQRVLGASAYGFWNDSIYAELGSYRSLSPSTQKNLGAGEDFQRLGANTYWRMAYFRDTCAQNYSVGLFGWNAKLNPDRNTSASYDNHRNIGIDGSYQFLGTREHVATVTGSHLKARVISGETGDAAHLTESRVNLSYHYRNTWGGAIGLFDTHGSDPAYATRGQIFQLDWTPWGKDDAVAPSPFGMANLRVGLQYWRYSQYDGDVNTAADHNTLGLFAWTSF